MFCASAPKLGPQGQPSISIFWSTSRGEVWVTSDKPYYGSSVNLQCVYIPTNILVQRPSDAGHHDTQCADNYLVIDITLCICAHA
jgi:hypothetical protein